MPFRQREIDVHALTSTDRDTQAARGAIEAVRLVLSLQDRTAYERDRRPLPLPHTSPIDLESGESNLESARDVLLVQIVLVGKDSIRGSLKPHPGPNVLAKRDPNRLVDDESEFREQSGKGQRQAPDWEGQA